MRRKNLVPRGTPLWCVFDNDPPAILNGPLCEVDGDTAVIGDHYNRFTFPLHRCFFTKEGAVRYIQDVLGGGEAWN